MNREIFLCADNKQINIAVWGNVSNPIGVVQIIHGMAEHIERYNDFALFLNERGYIVIGDDHRAHGLTDKDQLGIANDGDVFEKTVMDEVELTNYAIDKYSLPVYIFSHSYGSFLMQRYLTAYTCKAKSVVLCGSAMMKGIVLNSGYLIAKRLNKKRADEAGKVFAKLTFDSYDKKLNEGKNAWLSFNKQNVEKYNEDELCGFTCSNGFYYWFFNGLKKIVKSKWRVKDKTLPILILSGEEDAVGSNTKLVKKLYKKLKKNGATVYLSICYNCRHEVLNEFNKNEVYNSIYNYFKNT